MPGEQGSDYQQLEVAKSTAAPEKKNWRSSLAGAAELLRKTLDKRKRPVGDWKVPDDAAATIRTIKDRNAELNQLNRLVSTDMQELNPSEVEQLTDLGLVSTQAKKLNRLYATEQQRITETNQRRQDIESRRDARVTQLMAEKDELKVQRAALKHDRNQVSLDGTPTYFKVAAQRDLLARNMQLLDLIAYWEEAKAEYELDGYHESQFMFPLIDEYTRQADDLSQEVAFSIGSLPLQAEAAAVETKIEDFRRMLRGVRARVQKAIDESMQGVQFLPSNQPEASSEHSQPDVQTLPEAEPANPQLEPTL